MSKKYGIVFQNDGKIFYYRSKDEYIVDNYVIVNTEKGVQFAKVVSVLEDTDEELNEIVRLATDKDYESHLKNLKDADKALKKCIQLSKEMNLNMRVISATFSFDRNQLIFNFTADERIDFRELAKKLASIYHTRIELRQIGARDKAKEVGGIGICGIRLCCGNFLNKIESVSMNMAKNQNLALNPSKINGVCGRLLCCLAYEDNNYIESAKGMPSVGKEIKTDKGIGKVCSVDILNRKCQVLINDVKEEICFNENGKE